MVILNKPLLSMYKNQIKPILFKKDPEWVHDKTLTSAKILSHIAPARWLISASISYSHNSLVQQINNLTFKNPIGLAAGWDKDAVAVRLMSSLGFGFVEVGSITKNSYDGNERPRLTRLPKSKSILVNYGLKNEGVDIISDRLKKIKTNIPIGTNIARTNSPDCSDDQVSIEDYAYSFKKLAKIGDYFTINVSCPNTFGGQPFHNKDKLNRLLTRLDNIPTKKPVYLKVSPDISYKEREDIVSLIFKHRVDGVICGNLTKNRKLNTIRDINVPNIGGLSGKVVENLSNQLISDIYKLTKGQKTIIGLGGVFTAEDAYTKIKLGANLIQLMTGLIYQGPQIVGQLNYGLAELLKKDGYSNISQAVGAK